MIMVSNIGDLYVAISNNRKIYNIVVTMHILNRFTINFIEIKIF